MTAVLRTPQARVVAGIARVDITPPIGIYHRMWGAATQDQATGIHRPLTATALVLRSGSGRSEQTQYLLAVDHCLLWPRELQSFRQQVAESCGVQPEQLDVCFSHTHGAGLMGLERQELPGGEMIAGYLKELAERCGRMLRQALDEMRPAVLSMVQGRCALAANRDFPNPAGTGFVCGFNPDRKADDLVLAGQLTDDSGNVMAVLVNYACHPTTLAWENTLISPDYPGALREVVEEAVGSPCFFVLGACGELGPREGFVGDTQVADRNGRQLGYAVLSALESLPPRAGTEFCFAGAVTSGATLGAWEHREIAGQDALRFSVSRQLVVTAELPFAGSFPTVAELRAEREQLQKQQQAAIASGDQQGAAEVRALIERVDRAFLRYGSLPEGTHYPWQTVLRRTGDVYWVLLDGEYYSVLQTELRRRFPELCIVVGTVVNGSTVWYLPDQASYGLGLYQEQASVLAAGSLELVIDTVSDGIQKLATTGDGESGTGTAGETA